MHLSRVDRETPHRLSLSARHQSRVGTGISRGSEAAAILVRMPTTSAALTTADNRALVLRALRYPRGRYSAERAHQLSAVPARTLHDWATAGVLVPDWFAARPRGWSYRDIVYARLMAWLRSTWTVRLRRTASATSASC